MDVAPLLANANGAAIYPVTGTDGLTHLAFSVTLINVTSLPVTIRTVEPIDAATGKAVGRNEVAGMTGEDLSTRVRLFAKPPGVDESSFASVLPPGQAGALYLDVALDPAAAPPAWLRLRIAAVLDEGQPEEKSFTLQAPAVPVSCDPVVVLDRPLKGANWLNGNGCCHLLTPHRWVLQPFSGRQRPAEQFAIDFVKLDEESKLFSGSADRLDSYFYYGTDVIAAGAGMVVEVVDGLQDEVPGKDPAQVDVATAAGNHVIVSMGPDRHVLYAHLKPGSVAVKVGDKVRRGQRIGALGNSGNSDAPHLHFQVMDRPSALDADGIPFVFRDLKLAGAVAMTGEAMIDRLMAGEAVPIERGSARAEVTAMPLVLDVVDFR
jgi:murein DD-endopeptidase MepM/ murein hydrolase activator NlpD